MRGQNDRNFDWDRDYNRSASVIRSQYGALVSGSKNMASPVYKAEKPCRWASHIKCTTPWKPPLHKSRTTRKSSYALEEISLFWTLQRTQWVHVLVKEGVCERHAVSCLPIWDSSDFGSEFLTNMTGPQKWQNGQLRLFPLWIRVCLKRDESVCRSDRRDLRSFSFGVSRGQEYERESASDSLHMPSSSVADVPWQSRLFLCVLPDMGTSKHHAADGLASFHDRHYGPSDTRGHRQGGHFSAFLSSPHLRGDGRT